MSLRFKTNIYRTGFLNYLYLLLVSYSYICGRTLCDTLAVTTRISDFFPVTSSDFVILHRVAALILRVDLGPEDGFSQSEPRISSCLHRDYL